MPRFSEKQETELEKRIEQFKEDNPEFNFSTNLFVVEFGSVISNTNHEAGKEHKAITDLSNAEYETDNDALRKYREFYTSMLKCELKRMGLIDIDRSKEISVNTESFMNYENFMRGLFQDYVAPNLNMETTLKNYRFGSMGKDELTELGNTFNHTTKLWAYQQDRKSARNAGRDQSDAATLEEIMNFNPISKKDSFINRDIVSEAAVVYHCANYNYNHRPWYKFWFLPSVWHQRKVINAAKDYIQELRTPEDKEETSFENFVNDCCHEPGVETRKFDNLMDDISNFIESSKKTDKENPEYDYMNDPKNKPKDNIMDELYADDDEVLNDFEINKNEIQEVPERISDANINVK